MILWYKKQISTTSSAWIMHYLVDGLQTCAPLVNCHSDVYWVPTCTHMLVPPHMQVLVVAHVCTLSSFISHNDALAPVGVWQYSVRVTGPCAVTMGMESGAL